MSPNSDRTGRDRILAAAEELFAEHGYARTSTARLAEAAGVPASLIFYHFGTKHGLLLALVDEHSTRTLADLLPTDTPAEPRAAIAGLWKRLNRYLGEQTPMHRIVFAESDHDPRLRERAQEIYDSMISSVAGYLTEITGDRKPADRHRVAAHMLVTTCSARSLTPRPDPLTATAVADLLLRGLSAG